jgi:diadenosine tetraphosphate (Ap4A) HIT family hydrolase
VRSRSWDVVHCQGTSLTGWIVLVLGRHVTTMAELTQDEASELGLLVVAVSRALPAIVDCQKTYVVQFAEHPLHPHVHVHVIPRAAEAPAFERGPAVFPAHLGVGPDREVPESEKLRVAASLRDALHEAGFTSVR